MPKRFENIEDRSNNQLLAIKNIPRPAIKGKNNGSFGSDDENNGSFRNDDENNGSFGSDDKHKTIQDFKQELIDKNILLKRGVKKFDNIINKWKQTKDKEAVYKNVDVKVNTKKFNIDKIFKNYLNKKNDYKKINEIEKCIKDGIKIYQKRPRTDKNKRIINNNNKIIKAIELFKSLINNNELIIPREYNV